MKRTPMKRTVQMKRNQWGTSLAKLDQPRQRAENMRIRDVVDSLPLAKAVRPATYAGTMGAPVLKDIKAKPGKGAPTVEEKRWLDAIVSFGCVACWLDGRPSSGPAVHHILRGGRRIGHLYALPLCDPGHHQGGQSRGMVSRHPWKTRFEEMYGSEQTLLHGLQDKLGFPQLDWKP